MSSVGRDGDNAVAAEDFAAIEKAVMESQRGRWFLAEYARRQRGGETATLLNAIARLESAVAASQDTTTARLGKALGLAQPQGAAAAETADAAPPEPALAARHMRYFEDDEEIFAGPDEAEGEPRERAETARGARLIIHRRPGGDGPGDATHLETRDHAEAAAPEPMVMPAEFFPPPQPLPGPDSEPKRRIVIIRHKAGDEIDVPLQEELRASG